MENKTFQDTLQLRDEKGNLVLEAKGSKDDLVAIMEYFVKLKCKYPCFEIFNF